MSGKAKWALMGGAGVALLALIAVIVFVAWPSISASLGGTTDAGSGKLQVSSADIAAVAGVVSVLMLSWIGLTMTSVARRLHLHLPHDRDATPDHLSAHSMYRLVLALHDEVERLKDQVRALREGPAMGAAAAGQQDRIRSGADRGPSDLPADFYDTTEPLRPRPERAPRTAASAARDEPRPPPPPPLPRRGADRSLEISRLTASTHWTELVDAYQGLLAGRSSSADFERRYSPQTLGVDAQDVLRVVSSDRDAHFWLIPATDDPTLGVLVPAKGPIQQWAEQFQFGAGTRAHKVFGPAFRVDPGNDLELIEPAWVSVLPDGIEIARKGHLRGA